MKRDFRSIITEHFRDRKNKRTLAGIIAGLSVVVVVGVFLNLMQPTVTMTADPFCGLEEHTHTAEG